MKDYYLEQANRLEMQIAFAKVGYEIGRASCRERV